MMRANHGKSWAIAQFVDYPGEENLARSPMPPANRPPSWKEKKERVHRSDFIGRTQQLNAFRW